MYKTYSIIVKKNNFDDIDWRDVIQGLRNLQKALNREQHITCRMANSGDLLGTLPQNKLAELLTDVFRGGSRTITLCHGKLEVPPGESRQQLISEYHDGLLSGHKDVTKTYRRLRERYMWPTMVKLATTPQGNRYIFTMQDNFSKLCIAVHIPDLKKNTVAQNLFAQYGAPRCI